MRTLSIALLLTLLFLACGKQSSSHQSQDSLGSNQFDKNRLDSTKSLSIDQSDIKPAFSRSLFGGGWWRADEHDPSAIYFITDTLFNFVDQDPGSFFQYAIHYDTLIVFSADSAIFTIKMLTKDTLIMEYYGNSQTFIHTEPK
jgi:hypothetical protein